MTKTSSYLHAAGAVLAFGFFCSAASAAAQNAAPARISDNASRVTARVLEQKVWPPGVLENVRPLVPSDQPYYSLVLEILASEPGAEGLSHLAQAGQTLEVFSTTAPPKDIAGRSVNAVITLTGATDGVRWVVQSLSLTP